MSLSIMNAENRFRAGEKTLDETLARDIQILKDVTVRDLCARTYHYKNQYLSWCYQFTRESVVAYETKRISVFVTFMEPANLQNEDTLTVLIRSEMFQTGRLSRINETHEYKMPLTEFDRLGLTGMLAAAFKKGEDVL